MAFIGRKLRWDPYVTAKLRVACNMSATGVIRPRGSLPHGTRSAPELVNFSDADLVLALEGTCAQMVLLHGHGARDAGIIRARVHARSETTLPRRRRAPMARAMRSPAGARRSTVMVAATTAIARRFMTPMTRRIAIRPAQQWLQWSPRRRPCRQAVPASAGSVRPRPGASRQQAR